MYSLEDLNSVSMELGVEGCELPLMSSCTKTPIAYSVQKYFIDKPMSQSMSCDVRSILIYNIRHDWLPY